MTPSTSQEQLVSRIGRTGWRGGDRLVQLIAEGARIGLRLPPRLTLDLALRLLQPQSKAGAHAALGIKAHGVATARTDEGHAVLSFALPGDARLSVVLPPEVEQALVQGLANRAQPPRGLVH